MRRELILLLLGSISVSTISSLLLGFVAPEPDKIFLDTVLGAVGAGNFSYWQLGHTGPLLVELTSLSGDADLYVSDNNRPSYELDKYNFSSVTCGVDMVSIPADFPRPIGIGVFGGWSQHISEYSIKVFLDATATRQENDDDLASTEEVEVNDVILPFAWLRGQLPPERRKERTYNKKSEDETKPRYLRLLSILDTVFEMFVL